MPSHDSRGTQLKRRNMKIIRFTEKQPPYIAGDVAGFDDDVADRYVAGGMAEEVSMNETAADEVDDMVEVEAGVGEETAVAAAEPSPENRAARRRRKRQKS